MVYGHTPFSHLNLIQKLQSIVDPKYEIEFLPIENPHLLDVMKKTLQRDPSARLSIPQLLQHSFLHPEKYALRKTKLCQVSDLLPSLLTKKKSPLSSS